MFQEDGSLDPMLKAILWLILGIGIAKATWKWLTQDAWPWLRDDVGGWISQDIWGWLREHPWWFALLIVGTFVLLCFVVFSDRGGYATYDDAHDSEDGDDNSIDSADSAYSPPAPKALTFRMKQLAAMSAEGFEQACADLLARDGFLRPRRVGGSGDLGADVVAWDEDGDKIVLQCKQYSSAVGSEAVQRFNGTARPEHQAQVAVIVALNGFTRPATDFARRHGLVLVGRQELKRWAHGEHLYAAVEGEHSPA